MSILSRMPCRKKIVWCVFCKNRFKVKIPLKTYYRHFNVYNFQFITFLYARLKKSGHILARSCPSVYPSVILYLFSKVMPLYRLSIKMLYLTCPANSSYNIQEIYAKHGRNNHQHMTLCASKRDVTPSLFPRVIPLFRLKIVFLCLSGIILLHHFKYVSPTL